MITCTRRIQFCCGHRVYGHENKCSHLHGHNYVVELTAMGEAQEQDGIGRVVDFSVLKDRVGGWIEDNWDHGMLLWKNDPVVELVARLKASNGDLNKMYLLETNPTAENMALFLLKTVGPALLVGTGAKLVKVVVHETENCKAEAYL